METADCLIHFEATVNAPVKFVAITSIRCQSATDTKSILKSKYYQTYSIYEIFAAQLME